MKYLLLTDIPPCTNLTAGLVLDQLCQFMPPGSISCFTVLNPHLRPDVRPELSWLLIAYAAKPNELGVRRPRDSILGAPLSWAIEAYHRWGEVPKLIRKAEIFARDAGVDAIWAVLQGQTIIRMALPLAERLGVPLFTQVWDPPSWWLRAHDVNRLHARAVLRQFAATMRGSRACATASRAMADTYSQRYGTRCVPVIAGHDVAGSAEPASALSHPGEVTIAMAGQFYAAEEWNQLVHSLELAQWQVAGRKVRIRILGGQAPAYGQRMPQIEFLGWRSQSEAVQILSQADILYCPYPFAPEMEEVSRLSFPSKLVLYLACGRPILFHGPEWSSPGKYLADRQAGLICNQLSCAAIYNELQRFVIDPALYRQAASNASAAFRKDFTLSRMRQSFCEFLGIPEESLRRPVEARGIPRIPPEATELSPSLEQNRLPMRA